MRPPKNDTHFYVNGWLKYFDTTIDKVFEKHPEYHSDNRKFYQDYAVTQEQYDEWHKWAWKEIKKDIKAPDYVIRRSFGWLDIMPEVKEEQ